jgi:hypothetical protein
MASSNVLLTTTNLVDTATLTASSQMSTLPVTNLADYRPAVVWRSQLAAVDPNPTITLTCPSAQAMAAVIICLHNASLTGTYQVQLGNDPTFVNNLYDSGAGVSIWPATTGLGNAPLGLDGLGGFPPLSTYNQYRPYTILVLPQTYIAQYLRIIFSDPANTSGYIQFGRLFVGSVITPSINFKDGWTLGWPDTLSAVQRTDSGNARIMRRPKFRHLKLDWDYLPQSDAFPSFDDLGRIIGLSRDMFVVPFPQATLDIQYRTTIYGVPTVNGPLTQNQILFWSYTLELDELI